MYQNGDVDYLVATDAIGMGLNLDISHVAFSSLIKFDGRRMRRLAAHELAQIAGRAGRYMNPGTFGVTGEASPLDGDTVKAICDHRFTPVKKLQWRNARLQFGTMQGLISSLEQPTDDPWLTRSRDSDDLLALKNLAANEAVFQRVTTAPDVKRLWDVCRIPDFRGISAAEHAALLEQIHGFLHEYNRVPDDWLAQQVKRIDRTDGDIDTLSKRLAYIRTWTYVAQRKSWVDDETHWRGATRAVEDRLSDALHERLTQRFVDRRTSVLLRRLKQKEGLVADVNDKGEVTVEGEFVGRLKGFRFSQDSSASPEEAKTLRTASIQALKPEFHLRADRFYNAPDTEIDFTEQGGLMWGDHAVGKLTTGSDALKPQIEVFVDEEAGPDVAQKVQRRLQHFVDRKIATLFEPLLALSRDEALTGLAKGFAFRLVEALGMVPRDQVTSEVKDLDQEARGTLRKHGIRFGQFTIFMPLLLKPAPTRLRLVLWSLQKGLSEFPESPPPGLVTVPVEKNAPDGADCISGYRNAGERAIRIDMLERLADMLRGEDSRGGFEANPDMLSISGMTLEQFADLMGGLGYAAVKGERPKVKAPVEKLAEKPAEEKTEETKSGEDAATEAAGETVTDTAVADAAAQETPVSEPSVSTEAVSADAKPEGAEAEADKIAEADATEAKPEEPSAAAEADKAAEVDVTEAKPEEQAAKAEVTKAAEADTTEAKPEEPAAEIEVFYTFTWARKAPPRKTGAPRGQQKGKPNAKPGGKPKGKRPPQAKGGNQNQGAKTYQARPPRKEKPIDPDNPFAAALMGLRDKK